MQIARVALDVPLPQLFDYRAEGLNEAHLGCRVLVPFGRRQRVAILMALDQHSEIEPARLKSVMALLDEAPLLDSGLLQLLTFCSQYYQYPLGATLFTALPGRLRQTEALREAMPQQVCLTPAGQAALAALPAQARLQRQLFQALQQGGDWQVLVSMGASAPALLKHWLTQGWLEPVRGVAPELSPTDGPTLSPDQGHAVAALRELGAETALLFGITGSGKTEVYLQRLAEVLATGQQGLVLVPEINLTPQLLQRFRQRFPTARIACLHSEVSDAERAREWLACQAGERDLILGTRLAVFTPLPRLGLIVVDEEHDASYKQQEGLRYSARDVAVMRGRQAGVQVLLGSATPSLESWHNAQQARYRLLSLGQRAVAGAQLPEVVLLDTRRAPLRDGLSEALLRVLRQQLQRGEQSLLFLNRRGYAPVLFCDACGWQASCRRCSARLVWHRGERRLVCHHCGWGQAVPQHCPDCGNQDLKPVGSGTQRLEAALAEALPEARLLRVDRDSMRRKGSWQAAQQQIVAGEADILIGTQMLAKGHDFPNLTLVAVVGADGSLYSADYRASERLFAQLVQVAGRAGRADKPGRVLVQTAFPDHPLYVALTRHDYPAFAAQLLAERAQCLFPPLAYQAILRAEARTLEQALQWLQQARQLMLPEQAADTVEVFEPVPALMLRVNGRERAQLMLQSTTRAALQQRLRAVTPQLYGLPTPGVSWTLEVDPLDV
ncbi:primosomal protein N' [Leeia aquatica]|uniref:Replication restart protein PriA n=1 Tax=Leeia aquatica TaxID=2725557 RepID=A0A847S964_9NEIS|nr:primosomal protein N' [Leeia aquatica]NLR76303.1 primosomal protein N' [Leeia aquatica]